MSSHRILRVNENIKQILSTILLREIEDPRIKNNLVTITRIDTAKDLKEAKVYFVCLDPNKQNEVLNGLNSAKGIIFSYLRKQLTIRYVPNLTFYYDKTLMETNKVLSDIRNLDIKEDSQEEE
ncbi:30S ribosome-binding factor RbfA [uncultured Brachyspira sp.]|uniref:30S ribosome-binding factor RbfA n=1 Tax=uncultured Brachyspira sp. TaxID=221953 RepID=UPI0025E98293|nr:30S ribosome-binding factor RbfA [uncultured Brachyspira sp.]